MSKLITWNIEKNELLKQEQSICFEDVLIAFQSGNVLDKMVHPNKDKYSNQHIYIIKYNDYAYIVPCVESETELFLKTIIPSRKMTKKYLNY